MPVPNHFQQYFSYIVVVSFIYGSNQSTRIKPLTLIPITVIYSVLSGLNFNYIHSYSLRARTRLYTIHLHSYINAISGELKWEEDIVFSRNKMDIIDGIGKFELNCNGSSTVSPNKIKLIMSWYSFIYV